MHAWVFINLLCKFVKMHKRLLNFAVLQVKMGSIRLLLCCSQAVELKSRCEQAPYGCREETIVNTSVRNAWQLDASRLTID